MATVPTPNPTVPANLAGTLAGVAATLAVGALTHAGYLAIAAAAIGVPEATISVVAMALVGGVVNYGVTHYATLKTLNTIYSLAPTITADYTGTGNDPLPVVTTNIVTKDGTTGQ